MMGIIGILHLELTKSQITGHTSARFKKKLNRLMWEDPIQSCICEVER